MRWIPTLVILSLPALAYAQDAPALETGKETLSYAMGMDLGNQLKARSVDIDPITFARGLEDALSGGKTLLTETEAKAAISQLQKAMLVKQVEAARAAGEKNKAESDAFLAANKSKAGIVTLPSGLQYKVLTAGTGRKPGLSDSVVCRLRGTLINGKEFEATSKEGEPATRPVTGLIKGLTEVLQLMPVGSAWQVFVPSTLGYGERGAGTDIGPNATLIFDIELLGIK
jgi:FKBP-type peptidyl-prolyl cis-trans isomerase FklB